MNSLSIAQLHLHKHPCLNKGLPLEVKSTAAFRVIEYFRLFVRRTFYLPASSLRFLENLELHAYLGFSCDR